MADKKTKNETPADEVSVEAPVDVEATVEKPEPVEAEAAAPEDAEPEVAAPEAVEPEAAESESEAEPEAEPEAEEPAAAAEPAVAEAPAEEAVAEEPVAEEEAEDASGEPVDAAAAPEQAPAKKKRKRLPRALRHKHSRPARDGSAPRKPITRTPKPESELGRRQERRGIVVSDRGEKSIVVKVETIKAHPKYKKIVRRSRRLHVHDEQNAAGVGDVVRIVETRPLSKTKHWRLAEIVEKAR